MPNERTYRWLLITLLVALTSAAHSQAGVHDGGVGACSHCHVMHAEDSGMGGPQLGNPLLIGNNSSDLCLSCHATSFGSVLGMDPLAPPPEIGAGNFVFLLEDNINDGADGMANPISGDAAGHNLNAPSFGLSSDPTYPTSPGGSYPANKLKCTSCHDPHGNQNYRFLRGPGNQQGSGGNFSYRAPDAEGLDLVAGAPESNSNHVAYRNGMSLWCANCHLDYVSSNHQVVAGFEHPVNQAMDNAILNQYNIYNGSLDPTGGNPATAYLAAVPFEDASNTTHFKAGPTAASRIFCLTCHRAHASSAPLSGRWDFNVLTLGDDGVVSGSYPLPNPFTDPNQQPLCYKCHEILETTVDDFLEFNK
jgi:predicted CXXCH cytochrome family protein